MKFTSPQHRLIQAVLSMIVLQIALYSGDLLKIVTVMALLIIAWGLLLAIWLIDLTNANDRNNFNLGQEHPPHKKDTGSAP